MASDIQKCQANGKLVTISLGGATASVGFGSADQAASFAQTIWDMFLGEFFCCVHLSSPNPLISQAEVSASLYIIRLYSLTLTLDGPIRPFGSAVLDGYGILLSSKTFTNYLVQC